MYMYICTVHVYIYIRIKHIAAQVRERLVVAGRGTAVKERPGAVGGNSMRTTDSQVFPQRLRELFIYNLLVRIHFIIVMMRWTGLAPWEFEFSFPGSLTSIFLGSVRNPTNCRPILPPAAKLLRDSRFLAQLGLA